MVSLIISRLMHSSPYHTVELASLVALGMSKVVLCLASAVLTEVLGRLWYDILEELHLDSAQGLAAEGDVEEYYRVRRCGCHLCLDSVCVVEVR
jgi:hypothetical protein